jgi:ABC-type molybdate transport system substrate-binding protein
MDKHHEPLKGAVVQVHNEATDAVTSFVTDRSGGYSFKRLEGNTDYRVWATYKGQRSKAKFLSQFDRHTSKPVNLVITLQH